MTRPPLTPAQRRALEILALDPGAFQVEAGTLGSLRKRGLVGKHVERASAANGWHGRTTSPITEEGRRALEEQVEIAAARTPKP